MKFDGTFNAFYEGNRMMNCFFVLGRAYRLCFVSRIVPVLYLFVLIGLSAVAAKAQTFSPTGSLTTARRNHTAVRLGNGQVLVAGGYANGDLSASAELYNPATSTFSATGSMTTVRYNPVSTLLADGKVLVTGGRIDGSTSGSSAEFYNPATSTFSSAGNMTSAREYHAVTPLNNGKLLITGGSGNNSSNNSAELFDPASGTFSSIGNMTKRHSDHTATLLNNGKVLIAGGYDGSSFSASAELYDPSTGVFAATGNMMVRRAQHKAIALGNGKVLVLGGYNGSNTVASAELYDPTTGTFSATGGMASARRLDTATLLSDGKVLVTGGVGDDNISNLASAELYNPATGTFSSAGNMTTARYFHTATALNNSKILLIGGSDGSSDLASAELYNTVVTTTLSISDVSILEGNSNTTSAFFNVTLSPAASNAVSVSYATADGTASQPSDYTQTSGTLTFAAGENSKTISVPVKGDTTFEPNEAFFVNLSGANGATISDAQGLGTITNDDSVGARGGKIAFTSNRDGNFEIYVMNADGSNVTRLTTNAAGDFSPAWSPDGNRIAFESTRDGVNDIYTMKADGSDIVQITTDPAADNQPSWSPDGSKIAFSSLRSGHYEIWTVNSDGSGTPSRVTNNAHSATESAWSSNGENIFYTSSQDGLEDIYVSPANNPGASRVRLTNNAASDRDPVLNPVNGKLAFVSRRDTYPQIYTMNADGSSQTRVSISSTDDSTPAFNPSGDQIAFTLGGSSSTTDPEICVMNADGSNWKQLTDNSAADFSPTWTSGEIIAPLTISIADLTTPEGDGDVLRDRAVTVSLSAPVTQTVTVNYSTSGGTATPENDYLTLNNRTLTFNPGEQSKFIFVSIAGDTIDEPNETFNIVLSNSSGVMISDGQGVVTIQDDDDPPAVVSGKIAFWSNRDGNAEIYVMNADGTNTKRLTNNATSDFDPVLSRDGSKIAFWSNRDGNFEIYAMNADGTGQTRLTNNTVDDALPSFSPDGSKIIFISNDGINLMNSDGSGQTKIATDASGDSPTFSPDGSKILFSAIGNNGSNVDVYLMNLDGSNKVRLTTDIYDDSRPMFSPDGSKIVFLSNRDGVGSAYVKRQIYIMNADGTNQMRIVNDSFSYDRPVFSPDGSKIAFTSIRGSSLDIFVINVNDSAETQLTYTSSSDLVSSWSIGTVTNNSPTFSVALSNTSPKTLDRLTATATASNGGALSYAYVWKKNGTVIPDQTTQNLELALPGTGDKGDTITVEVTGNDNRGDESVAVASATVINSAPVGGLLTATSLGRQIISRVDAADPDNDPISYVLMPDSSTKGTVDGLDAGDGLFLFTPSSNPSDLSSPLDLSSYAGFALALGDGSETSMAPVKILLTPPPSANAKKYVSLGSNDNNALGASDFAHGYTALINGKINVYENGFPTYTLSNRGFNGLTISDLNRKVGGKSVLDLVFADQPAVITSWIGPTETLKFAALTPYATEAQADQFAGAFRNGYAAVLAGLKATGAKIVIANVPQLGQLPLATSLGFSGSQKTNLNTLSGKISNAINLAGASQGVAVVDLFNDSDLINAGNISPDGFHPNDTGYELLARKFFALLQPLLPAPAPSSGALISEFRLSGPGGARDEFIEIYNQTLVPIDLAGWSVGTGTARVTIPSGKALPPCSRLLITGADYSLSDYGGPGAAAGDIPSAFEADLPAGSILELRNALGVVVDSVNAANLAAPTSASSNWSHVRRLDGVGGAPQDTDVDANDFNTVDVASTVGPNTSTGISLNLLRLGAPGPQNLSSPSTYNSLISFVAATGVPPVVRTGSGNSGTLALRQTITNRAGSGRLITGVRFRFVAVTAGTTSAGSTLADIRPISSTATGSGTGGTIAPLVLQTPPDQPNGGGLNSTVSSVSLTNLPGGGLAPGQEITIEFLFNILQKGSYRYLINFEPLTTASP